MKKITARREAKREISCRFSRWRVLPSLKLRFIFAAGTFERDWELTTQSLAQMQLVADSNDADLMVALFPLPSLVTPAKFLKYYPPGLDIFDTSQFDAGWLQRSAHHQLDSLEIEYVDLTEAFRDSEDQPLFNTIADHHPNSNGYRLIGELMAEAALQ